MLDLNTFADKADLNVLCAVILEIWNLKAMEAGFKLDPCLGESASVPIKVKKRLTVQEELGTVI